MIKKIKKLIEEFKPDWIIKRISPILEGYNNEVYEVELKDKKIAVKILENKNLDSLKEIKVIDLIKNYDSSIPVPKIIFQKIKGKYQFIVMEFMKGSPLSKIKEDINLNQIMYDLGIIKAKINSIKYNQFGYLDEKGKVKKDKISLSLLKKEELLKILRDLEIQNYEKTFLDKQYNLLEKILPFFDKDIGPCLCHGDTSFPNLLVIKEGNDWKISGILDFEYAYSGGGVSDFFTSPLKIESFLDHKDSFIKGYTSILKIPNDWENIFFASIWIISLRWLELIPSMKWGDLSKKEAEKRKKNILKKIEKNIKIVEERF